MAYLNNMQVIPFYNSFNALPVVKYKHHMGLRLDLLLEVEQLGMAP